MNSDVARYLDDLVRTAREVPATGLIGAYAAGSVALDAYRPGRSDVDVALVCDAPLAPGTKRELVARLRHEALPCPARGQELVVYTRAAARSGTPAPAFELELNSGARMDFRATYAPELRPPGDGLFWYALDRSILHQSGLTLAGEPAADAFGEVPEADLRHLLAEALAWWLALDDPDAGPDAVLGACRALARVRHGVWLDKAGAGRRIIADGDAGHELIRRCLDARAGGPPPSAARARAFQRRALAEISTVAAGRAGPSGSRQGP